MSDNQHIELTDEAIAKAREWIVLALDEKLFYMSQRTIAFKAQESLAIFDAMRTRIKELEAEKEERQNEAMDRNLLTE